MRGISAVTMSKPWGGCGITIGWLAFQDLSIKQKLVRRAGTTHTCVWGGEHASGVPGVPADHARTHPRRRSRTHMPGEGRRGQ